MACGGPMRQTPLLPQGSGNYWPGWRSFKASQGMFPVGEYFQVLSKTVRTAKNVGTQIPGWPHSMFPTLSLEGLRQIYQAKGPFSSDRGVAGKLGFWSDGGGPMSTERGVLGLAESQIWDPDLGP